MDEKAEKRYPTSSSARHREEGDARRHYDVWGRRAVGDVNIGGSGGGGGSMVELMNYNMADEAGRYVPWRVLEREREIDRDTKQT